MLLHHRTNFSKRFGYVKTQRYLQIRNIILEIENIQCTTIKKLYFSYFSYYSRFNLRTITSTSSIGFHQERLKLLMDLFINYDLTEYILLRFRDMFYYVQIIIFVSLHYKVIYYPQVWVALIYKAITNWAYFYIDVTLALARLCRKSSLIYYLHFTESSKSYSFHDFILHFQL